MKHKVLKLSIVLLLFLMITAVHHSNKLRSDETTFPFQIGEKLSYAIKILGYHVGMTDIELVGIEEVNGVMCYHIIADTYSLPIVQEGTGYSLHDRIEGWLDVDSLLPVRQIKDIQEGSWEEYIEVNFDHAQKTGTYTTQRDPEIQEFEWNGTMMELLSIFYYTRSGIMGVGDHISVNYLDEKDHRVESVTIYCEEGDPLDNGTDTLLYRQTGARLNLSFKVMANRLRIPLLLKIDSFKISDWELRSIDIEAILAEYRPRENANVIRLMELD